MKISQHVQGYLDVDLYSLKFNPFIVFIHPLKYRVLMHWMKNA